MQYFRSSLDDLLVCGINNFVECYENDGSACLSIHDFVPDFFNEQVVYRIISARSL